MVEDKDQHKEPVNQAPKEEVSSKEEGTPEKKSSGLFSGMFRLFKKPKAKDDQSVGLAQNLLQVWVRIIGFRAAELGVDERFDMLHRAGPVERDHRRDVAQRGGFEVLYVTGHAAALHLEDAHRLSPGQQIEGH